MTFSMNVCGTPAALAGNAACVASRRTGRALAVRSAAAVGREKVRIVCEDEG
jgi:hypothetical protein